MKITFRPLFLCFFTWSVLVFTQSISAQPFQWQVSDMESGKWKFSLNADSLRFLSQELFVANLGKESIFFREDPLHPLLRRPASDFRALNKRFFAEKEEKGWQLLECRNPGKARLETFKRIICWKGQVLAEGSQQWKLIPETGEEIPADSVQIFQDRLLLFRSDGILSLDSLFQGRFYKSSGQRRKFNAPWFSCLLSDSSWIPLKGGAFLREMPGSFWWNDSTLLDSSSREVYWQSPGRSRQKIGDSVVVESARLLWVKSGKQSFLLFSNGKKIALKPHLERKVLNDSLCAVRAAIGWTIFSSAGNKHPLKSVITEIGKCSGNWILVRAGKRWGCADHSGIIRISCRYDSLLPLSQDRMGAKIGNVWGFLDRDERIRIQPNFEFIQPFKDSLCLVKQDGKWGLLKLNGQLELSCHFDYITQTSSGKWILKRGDWMGIADIKGKILLNTRYSNIIEAPPDLIRVERDGRTGLFNSKGNALLPLEFSRILPDYIHRILIAR